METSFIWASSDAVILAGWSRGAILDLSEYLVDGEVYYRVMEGPAGGSICGAGARYTDVFITASSGWKRPRLTRRHRIRNAADSDPSRTPDRPITGAIDNRIRPAYRFHLWGSRKKITLLRLIGRPGQTRCAAHQKIVNVLNTELNRSLG